MLVERDNNNDNNNNNNNNNNYYYCYYYNNSNNNNIIFIIKNLYSVYIFCYFRVILCVLTFSLVMTSSGYAHGHVTNTKKRLKRALRQNQTKQ